MITRRKFVLMLSAAIATRSAPSFAQQSQTIYRIGVLVTSRSLTESFVQGLHDLGYIEGKNCIIERRIAEGRIEDLPALARELVEKKVDIVFAPNRPSVAAAKQVAGRTPIVFASVGDPVGSGFVKTLARPGGNITGVTSITFEVAAKRLELLKESFPKVSRIIWFLGSPDASGAQTKEAERAAKALGLEVLRLRFDRPEQAARLLSELRTWKADAMDVLDWPANLTNRALFAQLAITAGLPLVAPSVEYAEAGALMSYGVNHAAQYRRAASYIDRILKGAKPGDLPVEQPTKFELVINLRTAKAIGVTIPQSVLVRADRVIE